MGCNKHGNNKRFKEKTMMGYNLRIGDEIYLHLKAYIQARNVKQSFCNWSLYLPINVCRCVVATYVNEAKVTTTLKQSLSLLL